MAAESVLDERYEVVRELGRGSAGELLLVRDRKRDLDRCALKVLRPRSPDPGLVPLFRAEFLLLDKVSHPSIVRVRDFGQLASGEPYFTLDYVAGENCRGFVSDERLEAHEYVECAAGLLGALASLHARGILHRDIKPENVIMRRGDGHLLPCLIDFGLAVMSAASRSGEATGTLPYIAPEVLAGGRAGPAGDLFSLGVLLYELCTGKPPGDRGELLREPGRVLAPDRIRRKLNQLARGSVPKRFEDLICRLTSPSPSARLPSATHALRALTDLYGEDAVGDPVDVVVRSLASEAPFVGRGTALASMMVRVDALTESTLLDPIVVVAGADGAGVSRMLSVVRNHAAVSGCTVYTGSSLRELAGEVVGCAPPGHEGPGALVFRIDASLHAAPPEEAPLVILDDVHKSAPAECEALRNWITALEGRPGRARQLLVLGGRNIGDGGGVELLRTAGNAVPVELRDLAPLRAIDIRAALSTIVGRDEVPEEAAQALHRASSGNPRLFSELLRGLVDEDVLDFEGDTPRLHADRLEKLELPEAIVDAARAGVARLDKGTRDLLARFALLRGPVPQAAALAIAGDRLADLTNAGLLFRSRGEVRFPHGAARAAADTLTGKARARDLKLVARQIQAVAPVAAAELWMEGGDAEAALRIGLPAARDLIAAGRTERARRLLEELSGETPGGEVSRLLQRARHLAGHADSAARLGRLLLDQGDDDIDVLMTTVSALNDLGQAEQALALLARAPGESQRVINAEAGLLASMGRHAEALDASRRAEAAQGSLIDPRGVVARARANILRRSGRRGAANDVEEFLIASGDAVEAGVRAMAFCNRALARLYDGRVMDSIRAARAGLRVQARRPWIAGRLNAAQAMALLSAGRPERAARLFARAGALFAAAAMVPDARAALTSEASALLACGRPGEADARIERAAGLPGPGATDRLSPARIERLFLAGRVEDALARCRDRLARPGRGLAPAAVQAARLTASLDDVDATEEAWATALHHVRTERKRDLMPRIRVGVAEWHGRRGAWRLAERTLDRCRSDLLALKTALRARALVVRANASIHKQEPAAAIRFVEEAVAIANRTNHAPLIADVYRAAASLLGDGEAQRYLRRPTAAEAATLLEAARDIWVNYGNELMLRKIDLHLSELPRTAADPLAAAGSDKLVKVLHIAREMNQQFDRDRLLQLILDRAIELTGAERGFVILLKEGRTDVHIARNLDRESLSEPEQRVSSQIIGEVISTGRIVRSEDAELDKRFEEFLSVRQMHLKSIIAVPFRSGGKTIGALYLDNRFRMGNFGDEEERLLGLFSDQAVTAIEKAAMIRELKAQGEELRSRDRLQQAELKRQGKELRSARREISRHRRARGYGFDRVVARSVSMQAVVRELKRFADSDLSVLLVGDRGVGKEMLAMAMHYESKRQSMPCRTINCAGYPDSLEAELFGHVRGAVAGMDRDRPGLLEEADGGTLFLDEIEELEPALQVRLLRTLETGEVRRVGDPHVRTVDVRIIAASGLGIENAVRNGRLREDLYLRLSGFVQHVPPLRERLEDLEPLAYAFVEEAARREGRANLQISNEAVAKLESYVWPGNVRELRSVVLRAAVTAQADVIMPDDIAFEARSPALLRGLEAGEADRVVDALSGAGVELNERQHAAVTRVLARGKLTFGEYQKLFRISKSTTARDLEALLGMKLLEKRGKTRAVVYVPGEKLRKAVKKFGRG